MNEQIDIPLVDERVKYQGTSSLRMMNSRALLKMKGPIVFQLGTGKRLAVLIPYDQFIALQDKSR